MKKTLSLLLLILSAALSTPTSASVVEFEFNLEFSGGEEPSGTAPWMVVSFDDQGTPGSVQMTLSTSGLSGSESLSS
ncbi:MAG: hypothetical protein L0Y32_04520, partial [Nevskiales bacterium]|nr:hypothetical protein [Nevskiales bacterium]